MSTRKPELTVHCCKKRKVLASSLGLSLLLIISQATNVGAQSTTPPDDAQTFRADFTRALDLLDQVLAETNSAEGIQLTADARAKVAATSDEQLAKVFGAGGPPDLTAWVGALEDLQSITVQSTPAGSSAAASGGSSQPAMSRIMSAGLPNASPGLPQCDNIAHSPGFIFGALVAHQVARAALKGLQWACDEVVLGFSAPFPCISLEEAADATAIPFELGDFCANVDNAFINEGSYDRLEHVHDDLESTGAAIISATESSATTIVSTINARTASIINNDNSNRTSILGDIDASRTSIIDNDNSNTSSLLSDIDASRMSIINNDNSNTNTIVSDVDAKAAALSAQVAALQKTVDTVVAKQTVSLQVTEINTGKEYLVTATEAGLPVDVTITVLDISRALSTVTFTNALGDATITSLRTGVLDVKLGPSSPTDWKLVEVTVKHSHGADPAHFGTAMVHRTASANLVSAR